MKLGYMTAIEISFAEFAIGPSPIERHSNENEFCIQSVSERSDCDFMFETNLTADFMQNGDFNSNFNGTISAILCKYHIVNLRT